MSYINLQSQRSCVTDNQNKQLEYKGFLKFIKTDHEIANRQTQLFGDAKQIVQLLVQQIVSSAYRKIKLNELLAYVAVKSTFSVLVNDPNMGITSNAPSLALHNKNIIRGEQQPKNYAFIDGSIGMVKLKQDENKLYKKPSIHSEQSLKAKSSTKKVIKRTSKRALAKHHNQLSNQLQSNSKQSGCKNINEPSLMTFVGLVEEQEEDKINNYLRYIKIERQNNSKMATSSQTPKQSQINVNQQGLSQQQELKAINLKANKNKNSKSFNLMSYQNCVTIKEGIKHSNVYGQDCERMSQNISSKVKRVSNARDKINKTNNRNVQLQIDNGQKVYTEIIHKGQIKENSRRGSFGMKAESTTAFSLPKLGINTDWHENNIKQDSLHSPNLDEKLKIGEYSNKLQIFMSNNIQSGKTVFKAKTNFDEKNNIKCIQMSGKSTACNFRSDQNQMPKLSEEMKGEGKQQKKKSKMAKKDEIDSANGVIRKTKESQFSLPHISKGVRNNKIL